METSAQKMFLPHITKYATIRPIDVSRSYTGGYKNATPLAENSFYHDRNSVIITLKTIFETTITYNEVPIATIRERNRRCGKTNFNYK